MKEFIARRIPGRLQELFLKASVRPRFDAWKDAHPTGTIGGGPREKRERLFATVAPEGPITYLEFGVHEGVSLLWWARHSSHPQSRFHGFDSFLGLPEDWLAHRPAGAFSTGGKLPESDDPRISFHKGWFHETLPKFLQETDLRNRQIFHFDADLYRSTIYPLLLCGSHMRPGDILIFDEFMDSAHEFRAWEDFITIFGFHYEVLAATNGYCQVAMRIKSDITASR